MVRRTDAMNETSSSPVVAVVGATGVVGREMLAILAERDFPCARVLALASRRSAGSEVTFRGAPLTVREATPEAFEGVDIALFSAGGSVSRELAPAAAARGAVVIDNSSAWRLDDEVPLVVPEVNPDAIGNRAKGIIANPNCSTIQLVVALAPIDRLSPLRHIVVTTYQAASGKGQAALAELSRQTADLAAGRALVAQVFPAPIAGNLVMDWPPGRDGYSEEELKLVHESRKILGRPDLGVSPTCVRVPVATGHSEAVWVRTEAPISARQVRDALDGAPGVAIDDPGPYTPGGHPQPLLAAGTDPVFVGRVRDDLAVPGTVHLWVVADNLRKGAALNAVQIAEVVAAEARP